VLYTWELFKQISGIGKVLFNIINLIEKSAIKKFNYLGCYILCSYDKDLEENLSRFQHTCGIIRRMLKNKTRKDTQINFYNVLVVPMLMCRSEKRLCIDLKGGKLKRQKCAL
jgi:hypothetical protein